MVSAIARLPAGLHHGSAQSTRFSCEIKLINPEYYATACIFVDYGAIKSGQANLETLARGCVNRIATTTIKHPVASHYATPELWHLRNSNVRTEQRSFAELRAFSAENFVSIVKTTWSRFVVFYILCECRIDQDWLWSIWNNRRGFYEILRDNRQTVNNSYKREHNEKTMRKREFLAS